MLGVCHVPLFLLSGLLLSMLPGPATMYIVGRSVSQGRGAGVLSVLGIGSGSLFHVVAVAFGLSTLLAASQAAFQVIKFLGAGYLVYLGIQTLRAKTNLSQDQENLPRPLAARFIYGQGVVTQILNPKVSLFFLAILPQFVLPTAAHSPLPFLFLGGLFVCLDTSWFLLVAALSARLTKWLRRSARFQKTLQWATEFLYIGLGLSLLRVRTRMAS